MGGENLKPGATPLPTPDYSKAPVQIGTGVIVAAPPAIVWSVLTDLDQWGAWNTKVTKVAAAPGLNVGTEIAYSWEEHEVKAVVEEMKENEVLQWKGTRTGSDAKLRWILQPVPAGTSLNLFAVLKPGAGETPKANAFLEVNAWLEALKAEAEKRSPPPTPTPMPTKRKKKAVKTPVPQP
jgi:uncharacterized protein YndB with AHSA1/START domain